MGACGTLNDLDLTRFAVSRLLEMTASGPLWHLSLRLHHSTCPCLTMSFTPTSVLVTGGAGFIGSNYLLHVVRAWPETLYVNLDALTYAGNLANLASVEDAPNYRFVHGDINDAELLARLFAEHAFEAVVHFAAESHVDRSILDPTAFVTTNVHGTLVLLQAARTAWDGAGTPRRFHHISTDEVFGSLGPEGVFTAETPYAPRSPYAASKASADHLVRAFGTTYHLPYVITNTSNNYGPYQFPEKLIPLVIRNAMKGEPIPVYGNGQNVRDWLYVEDHVKALDIVLRRAEEGSTWLIGADQEINNLDLVHLLLDEVDRVTGKHAGTSRALIRFVADRPGHDFRYALDSSPIEDQLGWKPEYDLNAGIRRTVAWYLDNVPWMDAVLDGAYRDYYSSQYGSRGMN